MNPSTFIILFYGSIIIFVCTLLYVWYLIEKSKTKGN